MAGQQKIQDYLQKHKISGLFEELMAKVISEMPDEPIPYLIRALERKHGRTSGSTLRRSNGDLGRTRGGSPDMMRKTAPAGSAAAWATSDGMAVAKSGLHDKPWKTNSKRLKPKKAEDIKGGRPTSAEDLFNTTGAARRSTPSRLRREGSPPPPTRASWADTHDDEDDLLYVSHGYRGPRRNKQDQDPLAGEFRVTKEKTQQKEETHQREYPAKMKGPKSDSLKHKQNLEAMVLRSRKTPDSGIEEDQDLDSDDAVEVMENLDDLRSEGVTKVRSKGVRVSKSSRRGVRVPEPQVKVSICSRCAKVMTGSSPGSSQPADGTQYGELPDYNYDSDREFSSRPQSSVRVSPGPSDDEFESVSQVSGPRRVPAWQNEDSDGETVPSRKAATMHRSEDVYRSFTSEQSGSPSRGVLRQTWHPSIPNDSSEIGSPPKEVTFDKASARTYDLESVHTNDKEDNDDSRSATSPSTLAAKGWNPPATDYDTDDIMSSIADGKGRGYSGAY